MRLHISSTLSWYCINVVNSFLLFAAPPSYQKSELALSLFWFFLLKKSNNQVENHLIVAFLIIFQKLVAIRWIVAKKVFRYNKMFCFLVVYFLNCVLMIE